MPLDKDGNKKVKPKGDKKDEPPAAKRPSKKHKEDPEPK